MSFSQKLYHIPCGKLLHNYGKSPHLMGKKYRTKPWLSMGHGFKKAQVMAHHPTNLRRCSLANGIKWPNTEEVLSENIWTYDLIWLVVWNMAFICFYDFSYIYNIYIYTYYIYIYGVILPTDFHSIIFQRGRAQPAGTAWNPYPGMGPLDERLGIWNHVYVCVS